MPLPKPPAVIFDWDGTLVDTVPLIYACVNKTRAAFGMPPEDPASVRHYTAMTKEESFIHRFGADNAKRALQMYQDFIDEVHDPMFADPVTRDKFIMPDAVAVLDFLNANDIPMMVVSNKTSRWLHDEVRFLGWQSYFRTVLGSADLPHTKPDGRAAEYALEKAGVKFDKDIWFIGDSQADVMCANNAGVCSIYMSQYPYNYESQPQFRMQNYAELLTNLSTVFGQGIGK